MDQTEKVTVIAEDPHLDFTNARMDRLPFEPKITIQPAFARHGSRELNFRLEDNARLYGKYTDRTKSFQSFQQKLTQHADDRHFPTK